MDVSIIIVAWNVQDFLHNCLKSIYKESKGIEFEVIYVDNASKDGSVEMVRKNFPKVKIIQNSRNKGFTAANNQAIEEAKGRYVLLLNSDTIVLDDAIAKTIKFADAYPRTAVVGCKVLNPDKTLQPTCFMFPSILNMLLSTSYLYKLFRKSKFFGRERMTWWDRSDTREVDVVTGCYMLVRRKAIDQAGVMDERFFIYADETDWCYRFKKRGWKILFVSEPEIIHYGGQTTKQKADTFKFQLHGSKLIFMKKHGNRLTFPLACFLMALFFFLRIPYWLAMGILHRNERKKAIHTVKTYLIGGFYCLADWKELLMNKEGIEAKL